MTNEKPAAREYGKLSVAHASSYEAVEMAQRARVSVLTHVPLDKALTFLETQAKQMLPQGFTFDYAGESRQLRVEGS